MQVFNINKVMMRKQFFNNRFVQGLAVTALLFGQACTDLDPSVGDSVVIESATGEFTGVADPASSLEALYTSGASNGLGLYQQNTQTDDYALNEVAADNIAVLTRGADWGDNGVWRQMHLHTWDANHLYILQAWNKHNAAVLAATQLIDSRSNPTASQEAQARVIRAFHTYSLLHLFGQVPFRGVDDGPDVDPTVQTTAEAFAFLMDDLNTAIASGGLSDHGPGAALINEDNRGLSLSGVGQAFALFLRARANLNAEVMTGTAGDMSQVIADVNGIEALGFQLDLVDEPGETIFDKFDLDNGTNQEVILALQNDARTRIHNMLHPNQGGWNGFVTLTETFRLHGTEDPTEDLRLGLAGPDVNGVSVGYIRGQQLAGDGTALEDRQGNPLVYENVLLTNLFVNNERNGIRIIKFPTRGDNGLAPGFFNAFPYARFADAMLMRAEATLRGGSGGPSALDDVNAIRARAGVAPLASITLAEIPDEITKEMNGEGAVGGRRQVQLRFGTFNDTWEMKVVTDTFRNLYAIPGSALATNPNLVQNPGY